MTITINLNELVILFLLSLLLFTAFWYVFKLIPVLWDIQFKKIDPLLKEREEKKIEILKEKIKNEFINKS